MADQYEYVENTDKPWRSSYSHQRRPDVTARAAKMIPRDRLVTKKGRYFTTNTSQQKLEDEIDLQDERKEAQVFPTPIPAREQEAKPKQRFSAKNAGGK